MFRRSELNAFFIVNLDGDKEFWIVDVSRIDVRILDINWCLYRRSEDQSIAMNSVHDDLNSS